METYIINDYWKKYQFFFPVKFQIGPLEKINEEYWMWKGKNIHLDSIKIENTLGTVILVHGAGGYGRFLAPLGKAIQSSGFDYIAPDLPSYGLSKVKQPISYTDWINCLSDLVDNIAKEGKPVFLFGLSIGGILAYEVAAINKHVKGVIATTLIVPSDREVSDALVSNRFFSRVGLPLLNLFGKFFDNINLPISIFCKMNEMSNNKEFTRLVLKDKLGGANKVSVKFLRTMMNAQVFSPEKFHKPILLVHPENDTWTPLELSEKFFNRIKSNKKIVILENCGHAPIEEPGVTTLELAVKEFLENLIIIDR